MTALPPIANVVKVRLFWDVDGYGATNILHWQYDGDPPLPADCATFASHFNTNAKFYMQDALSEQAHRWVHFIGCVVTDLSSDTGAEGQDLTDWYGVINTDIVGCQVAACVRWPISLRYRGGHPKTFFPSLPSSSSADGSNWTSIAAEDWSNRVNSWVDSMTGDTSGSTSIQAHCMVSYFTGGAMRTTPISIALGAGICDTRMGSMRRRRNQPLGI